MRRHRWPWHPLRPKRSELSPQHCAPAEASTSFNCDKNPTTTKDEDHEKPKTKNPKLKKGTLLMSEKWEHF
jgi:hypothetical protein